MKSAQTKKGFSALHNQPALDISVRWIAVLGKQLIDTCLAEHRELLGGESLSPTASSVEEGLVDLPIAVNLEVGSGDVGRLAHLGCEVATRAEMMLQALLLKLFADAGRRAEIWRSGLSMRKTHSPRGCL